MLSCKSELIFLSPFFLNLLILFLLKGKRQNQSVLFRYLFQPMIVIYANQIKKWSKPSSKMLYKLIEVAQRGSKIGVLWVRGNKKTKIVTTYKDAKPLWFITGINLFLFGFWAGL